MHKEAIPVSQLCRVLGICCSAYYAAKQRQAKPRICALTPHIKATFESSGKTYGSRRMVKAMANKGFKIGRYKIRSLMHKNQLKTVWKRRFTHTTDSKHGLPIAENILNRDFKPEAHNKAFGCDITYIRTLAGWLYLAVVIDLFSRKVVGWAMAPSMPAHLVCEALNMAIQTRRPNAGLIVHSDRGSQYASAEYQALLNQHGFVCSMSRKGNCWDNAVTERFFLSLKMERVWQGRYANYAEAERDIVNYIVGFYNTERLHSTLGYVSPAAYELKMLKNTPVECLI